MGIDKYSITLTGLTDVIIDDVYYRETTGTTDHQIPIYLDEKVSNLGVMVGFDGDMEQIDQYCNFTYSGDGMEITIYASTNTDKIKTMDDVEFDINWGDSTPNGILVVPPTIDGVDLPKLSHTYTTTDPKDITVSITLPWGLYEIKRNFVLPFVNDYSTNTGYTSLGTLTFNVPYTNTVQTQNYLTPYSGTTGSTPYTTVSFMAMGKSRINEFKKYGTNNGNISGVTTGTNENGEPYQKYVIDGLTYFDYVDGHTHITGSTSGTTGFDGVTYINEQVYNGMLTRDEFLIGFIDEPQIYSDIFVERGKQSVMERNLRLGEIDNMGELEIYGGGYFNVKKQ